jgi:tripartite-type tricarboxylate transporter receptor subunit TctC
MSAPRAFVSRLLAILAGFAVLPAALAQDAFPAARPIEFVVLFPAGTSADVTARVLAEGMGRQLGTQIVVVNRPGGGGAVGFKYAVQQAPDGHHLVWSSNAISTTYHTGMLPFDYQSFLPVARVQIETPLLFVRSEAPWKALRDILQQAKAKPGTLTVGNSGFGSHTHLSSVWLFKASGFQVVDVPFNAAQVVPSLLGGHVDAVVQLPGALAGHLKAGTVRALVAMSGARDPFFPDVPTAREQGMNLSAELWRGVAVPKGTPPRIITRLEDAIRKTVASPEFTRATEKLMVAPAFLPAAEFGKMIAMEDAEIGRTVKALGIKQDSK